MSLGFSYEKNTKSYYIDRHEREDVIKDRNTLFLGSYYLYEVRCRIWIQMATSQVIQLEQNTNGFPLQCYHYFELDGMEIQEYHINTHPSLRDLIQPALHQYG